MSLASASSLAALERACSTRQYVRIIPKLLIRAQARCLAGAHDKNEHRSAVKKLADTLRGYGAEEIFCTPNIGGVLHDGVAYDIDLPLGLAIGPRLEVKTSANTGSIYDHKIQFRYLKPTGARSLESLIEELGPNSVIDQIMEYDYVRTDIWTGSRLKGHRWLPWEN